MRGEGIKTTETGGYCEACGNDLYANGSVEFVTHWDGQKEYGYSYKCTKCGAIISLIFERSQEDASVHRQQVIADVEQFLNFEGKKKARRMSIIQLERLRGLFAEVK